MEKSFEMDLGEWELIPDTRHTFIDFGVASDNSFLFDIDYFSVDKKSSLTIEETEVCKDIAIVPPPVVMPMIITDHPDVASVVLFKKSKDDEKFVDMKIESPRIGAKGAIMPPVEPEHMLFDSEDESEFYKDEKHLEEKNDSEGTGIKEKNNFWKGVGVLCSVGVAAATLSIFMLGGRQSQKQDKYQKQKYQFQIYTDEQRIKQVMQQATRLNNVFSAARGIPMTRAHISFGGYYDGGL